MAISGSSGNDYIIASVQNQTYLGGAGNDTYIISNLVDSNSTIEIQDTDGSNVIQLIDGLVVTSSVVYNDALQITYSNGVNVQILGASSFGFEAGGNPLSGVSGVSQDYSTFATTTLGASHVPAAGESSVSGASNVTINNTVSSDNLQLLDAQGAPGSTVDVELYFTPPSGTDISALSTDITFDTTVLSNPTVTLGAAGTAAGKTIFDSSLADDTVRVGVLSLSNADPISEGVVADISFDIAAGAAVGSQTDLVQLASGSTPGGDAYSLSYDTGTVDIIAAAGQSVGISEILPNWIGDSGMGIF